MFGSTLPIHPMVVHFPIVLAVLLPIVGLFALWIGSATRRMGLAWFAFVGVSLMLMVSTYIAVETGEGDEEKVEKVVDNTFIETHAERAEIFIKLAAAMLVLSLVGFGPRRIGSIARGIAIVASFGIAAAAIGVGHSGGSLVFEHGAANAHIKGVTSPQDPPGN